MMVSERGVVSPELVAVATALRYASGGPCPLGPCPCGGEADGTSCLMSKRDLAVLTVICAAFAGACSPAPAAQSSPTRGPTASPSTAPATATATVNPTATASPGVRY